MCVQVSSSHVQIRVTNNFRSFAYTVQLSPTILTFQLYIIHFIVPRKGFLKVVKKFLRILTRALSVPSPRAVFHVCCVTILPNCCCVALQLIIAMMINILKFTANISLRT